MLVTGHFGHKTLRHQDTLGHFGTGLKTLRHHKRGTRHFDTSVVIEEKPRHFDPGQFWWDTAPTVIRLKLRHQFCGAEVSHSVLMPKCLVAEVSGSHHVVLGRVSVRRHQWRLCVVIDRYEDDQLTADCNITRHSSQQPTSSLSSIKQLDSVPGDESSRYVAKSPYHDPKSQAGKYAAFRGVIVYMYTNCCRWRRRATLTRGQ